MTGLNITGTSAIGTNGAATSASKSKIAATSTTAPDAARSITAPQADPKLQKVAQQFEAIFLRQMIGSMRSSSLAEGMFDSSATQQFRDMADAKTADELASTSRFGIADLLMKQLGPKATTAGVTPANAAVKMQDIASADARISGASAVKASTIKGSEGL
ncbi:MAG: hypothetical protein E2598_12695 [Sphingobium sp.]|nr:hypothetical protein [Sphingobium sp.]